MEATLPGSLGKLSRVLHLSGDYPDTFDSFKTPVIRTLVELTLSKFDHDVLSINRRNPAWAGFFLQTLRSLGKPPLGISTLPFDDGTAIRYDAPPKGIFHAAMLHRLGEYVAGRIMAGSARPDLLVGHKLAIEGIAIRRAADLTGIPYAVSIQGDTDTKIIEARPDLREELARVFHGARIVFPFAPWALKQVESRLGARTGPVSMLPCPTDIDTPTAPSPGGDGFISVFHLKNSARKNLHGMADAARLLDGKGQGVPLAIIGGGNANEMARCAKIAEGAHSITFAGPMDRAALRARMASATGFVMPSLRESFGLVFVEALFCGLPIIYPSATAVDGFFDGKPFAIRVDARDPQVIAAAMLEIRQNEQAIKSALAQWQQSPDARRFMREAIGETFASGLAQAIASNG